MEVLLFPAVLFNFRCAAFLFYQIHKHTWSFGAGSCHGSRARKCLVYTWGHSDNKIDGDKLRERW